MSKLDELCDAEGMSVEEMLDEYGTDSVCPAICMNPDCDYTTEAEHDCRRGYCEECGKKSVASFMVLMGII
jgi:hypothetical protein